MATTATFLTEFRSSMTFEYKTAMDVGQNDVLNNLTPHHSQQVSSHNEKSPEVNSEMERSSDLQHSPGSSRGTSLASSPALPLESTGISNGMSHEFSITDPNMEDPLSDDSVSMPNDLSGYNGDQDEMPSPLAQLQCALEKNGLLGKRLNLPAYPGGDGVRTHERNGLSVPQIEEQGSHYDDMMYKCHLCSYTSNLKAHFNSHMNSHFDHKCPFCDYTSRTEGRLKRHVKDFHSETPPDSWAGTRVPRNEGSGGELSMDDSVSSTGNNNNKPRTYRCKQCGFVAYKKNDFWEHNKIHIKAEKLLTCPQCAFVTEYKHHLEYHIRNHFGSKPFKCGKCNYSCVNKSMLNSHMKSHSNIYQYRCANCSYATKYCHSLKLHLRKYDHKPASVLNVDGTPNPYPVIDVYGTRRGPRPKKRKYANDSDTNDTANAPVVSCQASMNYPAMGPVVPPTMPMLYPPQFFNGYHGNVFVRPPTNGDGFRDMNHHVNTRFGISPNPQHLKCLFCDFSTDHQEMVQKHMLLHAAKENPDLIKLYGINSETILQMQEQQMAASNYVNHHHHHNRYVRENGVYKIEMESKNVKLAKTQENSEEINSELNFASSSVKDVPKPLEISTKDFQQTPKKEDEEGCKTLPKVNKDTSLSSENGNQTEEDHASNITSRSVIVSHKTANSKSPSSHNEQIVTDYKVPEKNNLKIPATSEASPLDLSNGKTSECRSPLISEDVDEISNCPNEVTMSNDTAYLSSLNNESSQNNSVYAQSRSRRKGKAFKLDRYLQYEDNNSLQTTGPSPENKISSNQKSVRKNNEIVKMSQHHHIHNSKAVTHTTMSNSFQGSEHLNSTKFLNVPTSQISTPPNFGEQIFTVPSQQLNDNSNLREVRVFENKTPTIVSHVLSPKDVQSLEVPQIVPKTEQDFIGVKETDTKWHDAYMCTYCDMAFRDCVMYTMHMGYHGYGDPYTCNMCGYESKDKVEFFLHIARAAHT